jgi:hypothetical protein
MQTYLETQGTTKKLGFLCGSFIIYKVILTKVNLAKHTCHCCMKCCFCDQDETIQYLFISCPSAKILWRIVYLAFNIPQTNIANLFGNWLKGVDKKDKSHIREGVCAKKHVF